MGNSTERRASGTDERRSTFPNATTSAAWAISANGDEIVGFYIDHGDIYSNGFILVMTTVDVPGAVSTGIQGVNNQGDIVGDYLDRSGIEHGFIGVPVSEPGSFEIFAVSLALLASYLRLRFGEHNDVRAGGGAPAQPPAARPWFTPVPARAGAPLVRETYRRATTAAKSIQIEASERVLSP